MLSDDVIVFVHCVCKWVFTVKLLLIEWIDFNDARQSYSARFPSLQDLFMTVKPGNHFRLFLETAALYTGADLGIL